MSKEKKDEIIKFVVNLNDCYYDGIDGKYYRNGSEISIKDELYSILRAAGYCPPYTCKISIMKYPDYVSKMAFITVAWYDKGGIDEIFNYPFCTYKERGNE